MSFVFLDSAGYISRLPEYSVSGLESKVPEIQFSCQPLMRSQTGSKTVEIAIVSFNIKVNGGV